MILDILDNTAQIDGILPEKSQLFAVNSHPASDTYQSTHFYLYAFMSFFFHKAVFETIIDICLLTPLKIDTTEKCIIHLRAVIYIKIQNYHTAGFMIQILPDCYLSAYSCFISHCHLSFLKIFY